MENNKCQWNVRPILTIKFKDVLRTFEAEILKIFKDIQSQLKIRRSYLKKITVSDLNLSFSEPTLKKGIRTDV